jgi:hypothetical protein
VAEQSDQAGVPAKGPSKGEPSPAEGLEGRAWATGFPEQFGKARLANPPDVPWPLFRGRPLYSHSTFADGSKLFPQMDVWSR